MFALSPAVSEWIGHGVLNQHVCSIKDKLFWFHVLQHQSQECNSHCCFATNSLESKIQIFDLPYMILARSFDAFWGMLLVYSPGGGIKFSRRKSPKRSLITLPLIFLKKNPNNNKSM